MGRILVGTASWADKALVQSRLFYPQGVNKPEDLLKFYASQFSLVEVDSTYYTIPSERNSRLWVERTPENFVFDVKAFGLLTTHPADVARLPKPVREMLPADAQEKEQVYPKDVPPQAMDLVWEMFGSTIRPLDDARKLGAVFLQFPKWFPCNTENMDYILKCKEKLPDYRIAVEFRQSSWLNAVNLERTVDFLEEHGLAYTAVDEPQGFKSSIPPVNAVTDDSLAVVRFHGRNADTWEKPGLTPSERFKYLYSEQELKEWISPLHQMSEQAREVHVLFNNNYQNYAQTNALQMKTLLEL